MKKVLVMILACSFLLLLPGAACAEESGWDMSVPTELTEEVQNLFDKAMEGLVGVNYTPVTVLGERDGLYCILCKAAVVYPGAEPYNALVYVNETGIINIYELWIENHAGKAEIAEENADGGMPGGPEETATEIAAENDIQYVLYLGTNDKDTNEPVFSEAEARERAKEILIRHFGGYTIQEASGGWMDEGTLYQEYTLVIYLSDTTADDVHAAADELIDTFRQSSVLIQANPTTTEFYTGEK